MKTQIDFQLIDSHHYIQSTENSTISKNDKNYENVPQTNPSAGDRDDNQIEVVIENPIYYPNQDETFFQSGTSDGPNVPQKPFLGSGSSDSPQKPFQGGGSSDGPFVPQKPFLGEPFTPGPGLYFIAFLFK